MEIFITDKPNIELAKTLLPFGDNDLINGSIISDKVLDYLVSQYINANYPDATYDYKVSLQCDQMTIEITGVDDGIADRIRGEIEDLLEKQQEPFVKHFLFRNPTSPWYREKSGVDNVSDFVLSLVTEAEEPLSDNWEIRTDYLDWIQAPERDFSDEKEFGVFWKLKSDSSLRSWRISWLTETGELYACECKKRGDENRRFIVHPREFRTQYHIEEYMGDWYKLSGDKYLDDYFPNGRKDGGRNG